MNLLPDKGFVEKGWHKPGLYDERDIKLVGVNGETVFEKNGVRIPPHFSDTAATIVATKYLRKTMSGFTETGFDEVLDRLVTTISDKAGGESRFIDQLNEVVYDAQKEKWSYFYRTPDGFDQFKQFRDELRWFLYHQYAAFNSPAYFNVGIQTFPQTSACFILSVDDTLKDIMRWVGIESKIFKRGSGAGVNVSNIRGSEEELSGGGIASGPLSFMRIADISAGAIKSGGTTRRAAKMVIMNVDHPDIEEFVECKSVEERKAGVLSDAGYDVGMDGSAAPNILFQNANHSVRVTDKFMRAATNGNQHQLVSRTTGETVKEVPAKTLLEKIALSAWECGDPGVQFHDTINVWNTCTAEGGDINGSNPCSEYMHIDNSACNLASLNLLKFLTEGGRFDVDKFCHAVRLMILSQDVFVDMSSYPTHTIAGRAKRFRQLGLGFANLGGLLMSLGIPYDSRYGRWVASSISSLMTGMAYHVSTEMAERLSPFTDYDFNQNSMRFVLLQHSEAFKDYRKEKKNYTKELHKVPELERFLDDIDVTAGVVWDDVLRREKVYGVRNSQVTVIAPTGTIGLMMDCDTLGIEPELALVKTKTLAGGGTIQMVPKCLTSALTTLGYNRKTVADIVEHVKSGRSIADHPLIFGEHEKVFETSLGEPRLPWEAHVKMMAAVQPHISGAISKTVNMRETATVEDVMDVYTKAWELELKSIAVYRDGCKQVQPLTVDKPEEEPETVETTVASSERRMPLVRNSRTLNFDVGGCKGYLTVTEAPDGKTGGSVYQSLETGFYHRRTFR